MKANIRCEKTGGTFVELMLIDIDEICSKLEEYERRERYENTGEPLDTDDEFIWRVFRGHDDFTGRLLFYPTDDPDEFMIPKDDRDFWGV